MMIEIEDLNLTSREPCENPSPNKSPSSLPVYEHNMSGSDNGSPGAGKPEDPRATEHLNIKVTDNNNEVFFKIKRTTQLKKLMDAFCERQGKAPNSVRFLFEGTRVGPTDSPETVSGLLEDILFTIPTLGDKPLLVLPELTLSVIA